MKNHKTVIKSIHIDKEVKTYYPFFKQILPKKAWMPIEAPSFVSWQANGEADELEDGEVSSETESDGMCPNVSSCVLILCIRCPTYWV